MRDTNGVAFVQTGVVGEFMLKTRMISKAYISLNPGISMNAVSCGWNLM